MTLSTSSSFRGPWREHRCLEEWSWAGVTQALVLDSTSPIASNMTNISWCLCWWLSCSVSQPWSLRIPSQNVFNVSLYKTPDSTDQLVSVNWGDFCFIGRHVKPSGRDPQRPGLRNIQELEQLILPNWTHLTLTGFNWPIPRGLEWCSCSIIDPPHKIQLYSFFSVFSFL